MSDFTQQLMGVVAARLSDQIWSIRDTSLQSYLGSHAAGSFSRLTSPTQAVEPERRGAVAVFSVEGVLVPEANWRGEVGSFALASALSAAARDEQIEAGVLLVNSPGGVCHGMLEATAAAAEFAGSKRLVAQVAGCCCSAAYNLASQCHEIFAGPRDDIGSIGTRSLIYDWSKWFAEAGLEAVASDTGPIKSIGAMGTEITAAQREFMQQRVDYLQEDFKRNVMSGRGMTEEQYDLVATGAWWFGEQAVSLGLIDGVQTSQQTFAGLESAISSVSILEKTTMAEKAIPEAAEPKPATLDQLEAKFPAADSDWVLGQLKAKATVEDAAIAFANHQAERAEAAEKERDEAKAEAEKAAAKPAPKAEAKPSTRGADLDQGDPTADADPAPTDFRSMARDLAKSKGISYREACRRVQKEHGSEARSGFRHAPLPDQL